ncbi:MAG: L-2-amino-thiazoline-4-carboxylic acid hydrolase [Anderseniella sp.]|nr:L-2-amino-thiazoline-4-carboxylic acid hydrolase [Anderseniella sp.]
MSKTDLPILEQRRIEANIIKPIYEEMKAEIGVEKARKIISAAITKNAIEQGSAYARTEGGNTSLESFHALLPQWKANGALEVDMLEETEANVNYNVTRCQYAEMYKEMGLAEIGHLLSCGRDGTFCEGYDPRISLIRTQTIMQGASHCDFRYSLKDEDA